MKPLAYIIGCLLVFAICGCGTQNRFASSFGKRRYNKGFYWNGGEGGKVTASAPHKHKDKPVSQPVAKKHAALPQQNAKVVAATKVSVKIPAKVVKHKTILAKVVAVVFPAKSALSGDGRHVTNDAGPKQNSVLSIASAVLLGLAALCLLGYISSINSVSAGLNYAAVTFFFFGGIVLDILTFIVAIIALAYPNGGLKILAELVLVLCIVIMLVILISSGLI